MHVIEGKDIAIKLNERRRLVARGTTLFRLRQAEKPEADVLVLNGFPVDQDRELTEGDEVALIRRGEVPSREELEGLLLARHGPGIHERVRGARVGIAGCGGLGSSVAVALARTGVGELLIVDYDVVEPSNLNRQQYFVDQIGRWKVEALAENLARINPYVQVTPRLLRLTRYNITSTFEACQVVCECFDRAESKRELLVTLRRTLPSTPLVTVSGLAGTGPASGIGSRRVFENTFLVGDTETAAGPGQGLLAPRVAVAAGYQASIVLRLLLGALSASEGD